MYIGVDIGTSSVKAVAIDNQGNIHAIKQIAYKIFSPKPDYQEQNPNEIFEATIQVIKQAMAEVGEVSIVAFSAAMHSLMAVDEKHKPLTNLITWADNRAKQIADNLRNTTLGKQIYQHTGTAIHAMSPLCKLLWFRENQPQLIEKAHKFIGIKEYIFARLFDEYVIDYSLASATGLFDIFSLDWFEESLALIGISEDKLSKPVDTVSIFQIKESKKLDYQEFVGIKFVIGASDGCLANLGTGAVQEGEVAATIGTSGAIRMTTYQPFVDEQMRTFCYYTTDNQYIIGGAINNGGIIVQWLREAFFPNEKLGNVFLLADSVPAGAEGLIFLPYLLGERAPIWDSSARGVFFGIGKNHTQAHFYRAVLEGVMYALYSVGKVFGEYKLQSSPLIPHQENETSNSIYASGGFTKSSFWVQMMADIFNQKIIVPNSSESTAIGACLLAMKGLGDVNNWNEAKKLIPKEKEFLPNQEKHLAYMKNFGVYEKLYSTLKPLFHQIY